MRFMQFTGLVILFSTVSLLVAQGVGIPKREDIPKYTKQLQSSPSVAERVKAAEMIGRRGGINVNDVEDAIEPLKKALAKDKDAKVRAASARALGDIRPEAEGTVDVLIDRLKNDSSKDVKMATVVALGQFGPDAKEAVPTLREMIKPLDPKKMAKDFQTIDAALKAITGMGKKKKG